MSSKTILVYISILSIIILGACSSGSSDSASGGGIYGTGKGKPAIASRGRLAVVDTQQFENYYKQQIKQYLDQYPNPYVKYKQANTLSRSANTNSNQDLTLAAGSQAIYQTMLSGRVGSRATIKVSTATTKEEDEDDKTDTVTDTETDIDGVGSNPLYSGESADGVRDFINAHFSITNLIEPMVDEADIVKTDGDYIYHLRGQQLDIIKHLDNSGQTTSFDLKQNTAGETHYKARDMYLYNQRLLIIYDVSGDLNSRNLIELYDVSNPLALTKISQSSVNFNINETRRRDGHVLIMGDYKYPEILNDTEFYLDYESYINNPGFYPIYKSLLNAFRFFVPVSANTAQQQWDRYIEIKKQQVDALPLADLLPAYTLNDAQKKTQHCVMNESMNLPDAYMPTLKAMINIDQNTLEKSAELCVPNIGTSDNQLYYVSPTSVYISVQFNNAQTTEQTPWVWNNPDALRIERFAYAENTISYNGFVEIPGILNENLSGSSSIDIGSDFSMHEYQNYLRVVNYKVENVSPTNIKKTYSNQLYVLRIDDQELINSANIPNDENQTAIGSAGEKIFAVRFIEDRAYVLTADESFVSSHPLTAISLSEPENPRVIGQLANLSFATYLHPVSDNLLLGIGYSKARPELEVRLFNIENDEPQLLDSLFLGTQNTGLAFDHKSLCIQQTNSTVTRLGYASNRAAQWRVDSESSARAELGEQAAINFFSVNEDTQSARLDKAQPLLFDKIDKYWQARCVLIDDSVYGLFENQSFKTQQWMDDQ